MKLFLTTVFALAACLTTASAGCKGEGCGKKKGDGADESTCSNTELVCCCKKGDGDDEA